jgi:hypothetical protein
MSRTSITLNAAGVPIVHRPAAHTRAAELLREIVGFDHAREARHRAIEKPVTGITAAERTVRESLRIRRNGPPDLETTGD